MIQNKRKNNGITLVALVVTIIILLILAGITISSLTNTGLFGRAKEAAFKTRMAEYKEKTNMYVSWKVTETLNPDTSEINAGEMLKKAIDDKIITDIEEEEITTNIEEVIENIPSLTPGAQTIAHCPGICSKSFPPSGASTRKVFTSGVS